MAKIVNKYPVGIQTFEDIREKGYLYIDKTKYIVDFREKGMKYVFLSRPRRFGKSLFASTLQAYFEGRKELFEGLAIADYEKDWVKHPVFHFDLSGAKHMSIEQLERYLADMLEEQETIWGYKTHQVDANLRLKDLVKKAYEKTGEQHYQTIFYLMFSFLNIYIRTEVKSAIGRADAVMHMPDTIYVFELKVDKSADEALAQIDEKGYMLPYHAEGKRLVKIGISFDSTQRTIRDWKIKEE